MPNTIVTVALSIIAVAMVTTLILPGRQTVAVTTAATQGFANDIRASMGL